MLKAKDILRELEIEKARRNFWAFCHLLAPDFYADDRWHLRLICDDLQKFYENKLLDESGEPYQFYMLLAPPQHGKSRTMFMFFAWVFGINQRERVICGSYSDPIAADFSKYCRDTIDMKSGLSDDIIYSDIFPNTRLKRGTSDVHKWALEGQHFNYLASGLGGGVTGTGATIQYCDDLIKGAKEAMSETYKRDAWRFFSSTLGSRIAVKGGKVKKIVTMTPWDEEDPTGRIRNSKNAKKWFIRQLPAIVNEEKKKMLCDDIMSYEGLMDVKADMDPIIFAANYLLKYGSAEGRLFKKEGIKLFKLDDIKNLIRKHRYAYIDPADKGTDSFSMPFADIYVKDGEPGIYIFDWFFEDNDVTYTAPTVAELLNKYKPEWTRIESNGAGNVTMELIKQHGAKTPMLAVPNTTAKHSRIVVNAPFITQWVHFLDESEYKEGSPYDKAVKEFFRYMRNESDNKGHDDAPDSISDLVTMCMSFAAEYFKK